MQVRAVSSGGELVLCSEGSAECQAYGRCSINACPWKVRDGVLGAEGRAGGMGGGEKTDLEGQVSQELCSRPRDHKFSTTPNPMSSGGS